MDLIATQLSECAATLLNVSSYFNANTLTTNTPATIEMLSDTTYTAETTDWTLRFSVSDPDGVYQVQLLHAFPDNTAGLLGCQELDNLQSATVEFNLPAVAILSSVNYIWLRVIDQHGTLETEHWVAYFR